VLDLSTAEAVQPHAFTGPAGAAASAPTQTGGGAQLVLAPYQAGWPARFRVEAEVLRVALSTLMPTVEHVGSTAVPGLAARPVIDMLLGLAAPVLIDAFAARLSNFGYTLLPPGSASAPRVLVRQVRGLRTHHVQVVATYSDDWHRILLFRDLLRHDDALARQFTLAKLDLMRQHHGDALAYANGKASFIRAIVGA
jgi:GrpB-like predicted nucleotidyltransferase (UPF0157 family)